MLGGMLVSTPQQKSERCRRDNLKDSDPALDRTHRRDRIASTIAFAVAFRVIHVPLLMLANRYNY
jgi:hypothetical protein